MPAKKKKKKDGWEGARDTAVTLEGTSYKHSRLRGRGRMTDLKAGEPWLSSLSTWPAPGWAVIYCWRLPRKADDTGDCRLGREAKPFSPASQTLARALEATPEGGLVFTLGVCIRTTYQAQQLWCSWGHVGYVLIWCHCTIECSVFEPRLAALQRHSPQPRPTQHSVQRPILSD